MAGSGRRFALEAAFLVGLAVAVGLAGLSAGRIIGVMALGWLLTALVELVSWRLAVRHPMGLAVDAPRAGPAEEPVPAAATPEPADGEPAPVAAEPEPPQREPADESMAVAAERPAVEGNSEPRAREAAMPPAPDEQEEADSVEAPSSAEEAGQPPPERRRGGLFRRRPSATDRNDAPGVASPPRHVRLIPKPTEVPTETDPAEDGAVRRAESGEGA